MGPNIFCEFFFQKNVYGYFERLHVALVLTEFWQFLLLKVAKSFKN